MKILISYGHDQVELVRKIKFDLEAIGHTVWIDEIGIRAGDDWRQKIEAAIKESSLVIALLSEHSTRDGGVCADELKIAYAYGCPIRTVLLDETARVNIPQFILNIQYLDLSMLGNATAERRNELYPSCFEKLVAMIEEGDYTQHKEISEQLAIRLHPDRVIRAKSVDVHSKYCKRQWLDECVQSWTVGTTSLSAIIGFPGSGKSFYCANSFYDSENICSVVFCRQFKGKNGVAKVLKNIAYQLAIRLFTYAKRLLWLLDNGDIDLSESNDSELFDILIAEPLCMEIDGVHLPVVIVLDGVDEMTKDGKNALANLIAENVDQLPTFVHFILTTRNNPAVTRMLAGRKCVELLPKDRKISVDIYNYLENALKGYLNADSADVTLRILTAKCSGSFLYASLIVEAITSGVISADDTDKYPEKIYDFYYRWMDALISDEDEFAEKYRNAFSVLVAARKPISERIILRALGWKSIDKIKFARLFHSFIIERSAFDGEPTIELFHSSFCDWLSDESGIADCYYVDPSDGLELYAKSLYEEYKAGTIRQSEVTELIAVLLKAGKREQLLDVAKNKELLDTIVSYAEQCQARNETYYVAVSIFDSIKGLSAMDGSNTYADVLVSAKLPYLEGAGEFSFGNLKRAASIIAPSIDPIKTICTQNDYLDALYILATSLDWLGDRREALSRFRELYKAANEMGNTKYIARALCGMIWNDHFNNSEEGVEWLKNLSAISGLDARDRLTVDLVRARFMLSLGDLRDSMALYLKAFADFKGILWGYDRECVHNQMLMLEVIVACYDNGLYVRAINIGKRIYDYLKGRGNLPECYCASWLACSYMRAGIIEKGIRYLQLAEQLNCKSKRAIRSGWMNMHLTSLRDFYEEESGNYAVAYDRYKVTEKIAEECDDAWVAGDACYSLFRLHFLFGTAMSDADKLIYGAKLNEIAQKSRLPHLEYKSVLVRMLTGSEKIDVEVLMLLTHRELPSVDVFSELCLCNDLAERFSLVNESRRIREAVVKKLRNIIDQNPDTPFMGRRLIKTVCERMRI